MNSTPPSLVLRLWTTDERRELLWDSSYVRNDYRTLDDFLDERDGEWLEATVEELTGLGIWSGQMRLASGVRDVRELSGHGFAATIADASGLPQQVEPLALIARVVG